MYIYTCIFSAELEGLGLPSSYMNVSSAGSSAPLPLWQCIYIPQIRAIPPSPPNTTLLEDNYCATSQASQRVWGNRDNMYVCTCTSIHVYTVEIRVWVVSASCFIAQLLPPNLVYRCEVPSTTTLSTGLASHWYTTNDINSCWQPVCYCHEWQSPSKVYLPLRLQDEVPPYMGASWEVKR